MAEFSKEYLEASNSDMIPDFSYIDELNNSFRELEMSWICEGFGSIGAKFLADGLYLIFLNSEPILLTELIEKRGLKPL